MHDYDIDRVRLEPGDLVFLASFAFGLGVLVGAGACAAIWWLS